VSDRSGVSEYQLYEFIAVDRPLTSSQRRELREISSRAEITSSSFRNEYNYGDLSADPAKLVARYFDVGVHMTNWGTRRLLLRFPKEAVKRSAALYAKGGTSITHARGNVVVDICPSFEPEDFNGYEDIDDTSFVQDLPTVRAAVLGGDLRPLYLAWLAGVQSGELDDDDREPPVPAGLGEKAPASALVIRFLQLDERLLKVAAKLSHKRPKATSTAPLIRKMPTPELRKIVERLAVDPAGASALLQRSLHRTDTRAAVRSSGRIVADLRAAFRDGDER
jgi:hypothetical protein